jgi:hypothetical protein
MHLGERDEGFDSSRIAVQVVARIDGSTPAGPCVGSPFDAFTLFSFSIFALAQLQDIPLEFSTKLSKTVMVFMLNVKI